MPGAFDFLIRSVGFLRGLFFFEWWGRGKRWAEEGVCVRGALSGQGALVPWQDRGRAYDSVDVRCGDGDMEKKVQGDMEKRVQESMVRVKSASACTSKGGLNTRASQPHA